MKTRTYEPRTTDTGATKSKIANEGSDRVIADPAADGRAPKETQTSKQPAEHLHDSRDETASDTAEKTEGPELRARWIQIGGDDLAVVSFSFDCSPPLDVLSRRRARGRHRAAGRAHQCQDCPQARHQGAHRRQSGRLHLSKGRGIFSNRAGRSHVANPPGSGASPQLEQIQTPIEVARGTGVADRAFQRAQRRPSQQRWRGSR